MEEEWKEGAKTLVIYILIAIASYLIGVLSKSGGCN